MLVMLFNVMGMLKETSPELFDPAYFEIRSCPNLGISIRTVRPVLQFVDGLIKPGFTVATRGNGVDQARWPTNLRIQAISEYT